MTFILWIIAISMVLTLFVIASVGRLFDESKQISDDVNPGAKISVEDLPIKMNLDDELNLLIEASKQKADERFYRQSEQTRTSTLAHKIAILEKGLFKVKMQIFTFGICLGALSMFMGIWAAIETVKLIN